MKKYAFQGGLLIDGTGAQAVENSLVLVDGDKTFKNENLAS